jgi:anti-anti-sigma factor
MLNVKVEQVDDAARIDFNGTTIDVQYGPLPEVVELIKQGMKKILVNLGGVEYFTSAGISSLIITFKLARENGVNIAIYNFQPQVKQTIERTGMFKILPCFDREDEAAAYVGLVTNESEISKREKILVIEKKLPISKVVNELFAEFKHLGNYKLMLQQELSLAQNYLCDFRDVHLIFLDVHFNAVDTQRFLDEIRKLPNYENVPVLIVTDEEKISQAHFYVRNGANDMLRYPINKYELETRINFALNFYEEVNCIKVPA